MHTRGSLIEAPLYHHDHAGHGDVLGGMPSYHCQRPVYSARFSDPSSDILSSLPHLTSYCRVIARRRTPVRSWVIFSTMSEGRVACDIDLASGLAGDQASHEAGFDQRAVEGVSIVESRRWWAHFGLLWTT